MIHRTKITKEVTFELERYYVVRLVEDRGTSKEVLKEINFDEFPSASEIADCLSRYVDTNVFASVVQNFRLRSVDEF